MTYWEATTNTNIYKVLDSTRVSEQGLVLWQKQDTRKLWTLKISSIDHKTFRVLSEVEPISHLERIDLKETIYVANMQKRDTIFKARILSVKKNKVIFSFPKIIKCIEKRENPRVSFDGAISRWANVTLEDIYGGKSKPFTLQVKDISTTGISFVFGAQKLTTLRPGSNVDINEICNVAVPEIRATILYVKEVKGRKSTLKNFRAGLQFDKKIPENIIALILAANY